VPDLHKFNEYICSVYAREAHKAGYLDINNILSPTEFNGLIQRIITGEFSKGYDKQKLLETLPTPSFKIERTILCYVSKDPVDKWIYFDLPSVFIDGKGYQDFLLSIRWPTETFEDGFELTKEGYDYTRRGIATPKFDGDKFMGTWIDGKKWELGECMPTIEEKPRESLWQHLW